MWIVENVKPYYEPVEDICFGLILLSQKRNLKLNL